MLLWNTIEAKGQESAHVKTGMSIIHPVWMWVYSWSLRNMHFHPF